MMLHFIFFLNPPSVISALKWDGSQQHTFLLLFLLLRFGRLLFRFLLGIGGLFRFLQNGLTTPQAGLHVLAHLLQESRQLRLLPPVALDVLIRVRLVFSLQQ